jgi:hypothetical protein
MEQDIIDRLVAGTYADPDGGGPLRVDTRAVVIARSLAGMEADAVRPLALGRRLAVVSDPTTHAILGERVERALMSLAEVTSVVAAGASSRRRRTVERLRAATVSADALVAVGSGTINDPLQVCQRARSQTLRGVRHGAVDERLHLAERRDHGARAQEVAAGAGAGRCRSSISRSWRPLRCG